MAEFRKMRRAAHEISEAECEKILKQGQYGVLSCLGDEQYPYAVPLNYLYDEGEILIHCARCGHKLDAIRAHNKVSFCVVEKSRILPERFTTAFSSVIVFGRAEVIDDPVRIRSITLRITNALAPDESREAVEAALDRYMEDAGAIVITPEQVTGKIGRELLADGMNGHRYERKNR